MSSHSTPGFELLVILNFSSIGSRPCLKKWEPGLQDVHDIWTGFTIGDIFQVWFSFHTIYLTTATGVWERKARSKIQATSAIFCLHAQAAKAHGMSTWTDHPTVLKLGYRLWSRCFEAACFCSNSFPGMRRCSQRTIFPKNMGGILAPSYELDKQWYRCLHLCFTG